MKLSRNVKGAHSHAGISTKSSCSVYIATMQWLLTWLVQGQRSY